MYTDICYTVCISSLVTMTWSTSYMLTLVLTCLFVGIMMTTLNIVIGATVLLFPTSLRYHLLYFYIIVSLLFFFPNERERVTDRLNFLARFFLFQFYSFVFFFFNRTMAVSLVMMTGRSGSLIGNVVFPVLLEYGCIAPIMTIACFPLRKYSFSRYKTEYFFVQIQTKISI